MPAASGFVGSDEIIAGNVDRRRRVGRNRCRQSKAWPFSAARDAAIAKNMPLAAAELAHRVYFTLVLDLAMRLAKAAEHQMIVRLRQVHKATEADIPKIVLKVGR
jgi:hypothetical protein